MRLFVKTLTGRTFELEVNGSDDILEVKRKFNIASAIPEDQFYLMFAGKKLLEEHLTPQLTALGFSRLDCVSVNKKKEIDYARSLLVCDYCDNKNCTVKMTLGDYNIQRESTLHVVIGLRGC